jgi:hypothetical protein
MEEEFVTSFNEIVNNSYNSMTISEAYEFLGIKIAVKLKNSSVIKPLDMSYDASYHRGVDKVKVKSIIENFNEKAVGLVTVSVRENGDLFIIDGVQRIEAMIYMGLGGHEVKINALHDLSIPEENKLFKIINNIQEWRENDSD